MRTACPDKTVDRVVLGPKQVGKEYARIVARADGSGRVELYDCQARTWRDAEERCGFYDLWRAPAVEHARHLSLL